MRLDALSRLLPVLCLVAAVSFAAEGSKSGKVTLKSAGPLAFGPAGVLFVGDSSQAAVVAIDTGDAKPSSGTSFEIKAINEKVAAALGVPADQILIQDAVVNPVSKNIYFSVSKGRGPDAPAAILRTDASGKVTALALDNLKHSSVSLIDAPAASDVNARGQSKRVETITDLAYVDGKVFVAGLSNEEFSSSFRSIPYPFQAATKATGVEIYHGSHGRFETNAPVRTFVPYTIGSEAYILAAYTCTPLVRIPVSELKPGNKVKGTTIAELGNRNRPLDMIVYKKDGKEFLLMANSSRGVMKLPAAKLESYPPITAHTEKEGVPYETIESLKGVQHLDKLNDTMAMLLVDDAGSMNLRTIPLP
jgi:hypothetical protein